jgi:tol-pal system protein YbgF
LFLVLPVLRITLVMMFVVNVMGRGLREIFGKSVMGVLVPVLVTGISAPVFAAKNDLYPQVVELDQRVGRLERVVDSDSLVDMITRLDQIQRELAILRNDVETLQYESQQSTERQRQLYLDVDRRLQAVEAATAAANATAASAAVVSGAALTAGKLPVPGGSAEENYQAAFELLKQSRYDEAIIGFQQFLAAFPESDLRGNAQYWMGETYYVTQKYSAALEAFQVVLSDYPNSRKIPDALLKMGFAYYEQKNYSQARKALNMVVTKYPESTAARLASERLAKMDQAGL